MPCGDASHCHFWATTGELVVERCEKTCAFCQKSFKHAWFLRRHVKDVHVKQYPYLKVCEGWTNSPEGNRKSNSPRKGRSRSTSTSTKSNRNNSGERTDGIPPIDFNAYTFSGETAPPAPDPFQCESVINLSDEEMETLFALPSIEEAQPTLPTEFVTPQWVRSSGELIERAKPEPSHHGTATALAEGLNSIVVGVAMKGTMSASEIVYVLETFTDLYKLGIVMPMPLPDF